MAQIIRAILIAIFITGCGSGSNEKPTPEEYVPPTYIGVAFLAARNPTVNCDWLTEIFDGIDYPALSVLWPSFGRRDECIRRFVQDSRPKVFNAYLYNGPAERKGNPGPLDRGSIEEQVMRNAGEVYGFWLGNAINTELILTLGLEDNLPASEAQRLLGLLRERFKDAKERIWFFRNPVGTVIPAATSFDGTELHNTARLQGNSNCAYSNDGEDLDLGNGRIWNLPYAVTVPGLLSRIREQFRDCRYLYIWRASFNGLRTDSSRAPIPSDRKIDLFSGETFLMNNLLRGLQDERNKQD